MIIQIDSATAANVTSAQQSLGDLARSWGHELTQVPAAATTPATSGGKAIDPVAIASLVLSIPPAALAAADLADRIRKRRRAAELIDHARHLAAQHVTICLISRSRAIELHTLDPDQLLDLAAADDPGS